MNSNTALNKGLESVAMALIFAPEPFTTIPGIILLAAIQANKAKNKAANPAPRYTNRFEDYYKHSIKLGGNGQLNYKVEPLKKGQIPRQLPATAKIYDTKVWEHYRKNAYSYLNTIKPVKTHFCGLQQGLLAAEPAVKDQLANASYVSTRSRDSKVWQQYRKKAYSYLAAEKPVKPHFSGLQQGLLNAEPEKKGQLLQRTNETTRADDNAKPHFSGLQRGLLKKTNRNHNKTTI